MNPESLTALAEPIGLVVGFLLTLMVLSYIIGDNPLFRLAIHIFIGVASGYAVALVFYNVLYYQIIVPLLSNSSGSMGLVVPALILFAWLLTKSSTRLAHLGNPLLAFLVGVGAAAAIGGAVLGTIFPQVSATATLFDLESVAQEKLVGHFLSGLTILIGTITTLAYFQFGVRARGESLTPSRSPLITNVLAPAGEFFIAVTFGVLFAGVYAAALSALIDRLAFLLDVIRHFISFG
ncbi:MAG: hypothetical protein JW726_00070 [Anaerolineales bacterium]|nr:hypothetical protein [Anaerolineales bacterium]